MKATFRFALLVSGSALALASCGGGSDGGAGGNPPGGPGPTALEDNFGPAFAAIFRAGANTPAVDPAANAVIAVSFTTPPVPVP